jgi:hypothetical protein
MPITPMHSYTVILLRPDYITDNYGQDTLLRHVDATGVKEALTKARKEVMKSDGTLDQAPQDYFCIALFEGAHPDLNPEM